MVLAFIPFLAAVAASSSISECSGATCLRPRMGRGISLLQASRNKSALVPATAESSLNSSKAQSASNSSKAHTSVNSSKGQSSSNSSKAQSSFNSSQAQNSLNSSTLTDAVAAAEALGNATEQAISGTSTSAVGDDSTVAVNLSEPGVSVNYSEVLDPGKQPALRAPYTQQQNETVPIIKPIKGAAPLPEPEASNITAAMRDCMLGDWGEWSECVSDGASGFEGPHQMRRRSVIQPWLPGGSRCGSTQEVQGCNLISAANTIVNLNVG
ncbi:unnamed protein product [Symbiodinium pilosum]|uniref:Uncharacterized protein n=1 Tax=Symbiodinium pilosum TaxID=2952 RepID=A0A812WNZ5_SYMPI|nr:unnamed protein product [Symbiodinium pilosum]